MVKMCPISIGHELAGLNVQTLPAKTIEGVFIFFAWVSSATQIFFSKVDFVGDICNRRSKNLGFFVITTQTLISVIKIVKYFGLVWGGGVKILHNGAPPLSVIKIVKYCVIWGGGGHWEMPKSYK